MFDTWTTAGTFQIAKRINFRKHYSAQVELTLTLAQKQIRQFLCFLNEAFSSPVNTYMYTWLETGRGIERYYTSS